MDDLLGINLLRHQSCVVNIIFIVSVCCWTTVTGLFLVKTLTSIVKVIASDNFCNTESLLITYKNLVWLLTSKLVEDFLD